MDGIRITGITIYPIKSTAGIAVDACAVEDQGLAMDRRWMVVDDDGECITGREFPILTQIRSRVEDDCLQVNAPGMDDTGQRKDGWIPLPEGSVLATRGGRELGRVSI